jgi:hypothetical protein
MEEAMSEEPKKKNDDYEASRREVPERRYRKPPVETQRRSIMELQGLGREVWEVIDAGRYIDELRDEWDNR